MIKYYKNLLVVFAVLMFTSCSEDKTDKLASPPKQKRPLVKVVEINPQKIENIIQLPGTFDVKITSNVIAPVDGNIDKFNLNENDYINKNQTIAVINSQERTALLANAQYKVNEAEKMLKSINPENENYLKAKKEYEKAIEDYKYSEKLYLPIPIVANLSGIVLKKFIEPGSVVTAKQILVTIADFNSLVLKTSLSEQLISKVKIGQSIKVNISAYPDKEFRGVISLIYPQTDPTTRTMLIELKVNTKGLKILPGMMALLTFVTDSKANAIVVPNDAILTKPNGDKFVFIIKDTTAQERIIKTGINTKEFTEVVSGINAKEKLVVLGQEMLKNKIKVSVQKPQIPKKDEVKSDIKVKEKK